MKHSHPKNKPIDFDIGVPRTATLNNPNQTTTFTLTPGSFTEVLEAAGDSILGKASFVYIFLVVSIFLARAELGGRL